METWIFPIFLGTLCGALISGLADNLPTLRRDPVSYPYQGGDTGGGSILSLQTLYLMGLMTCASMYIYQLEDILNKLYLLKMLFLAYLVLVSLIDIKRHRIHWITNLIGVPVALSVGFTHEGLVNSILGGLTNGIIFLVLYFLGKSIRWISRRAEDGVPLGFGDVLFSSILGLALGFPSSYLGIFAGSLLGLIAVSTLWISRKIRGKQAVTIPYAPFLALGTWIIMQLF